MRLLVISVVFATALLQAQTTHQHHPPASAGDYAKILEDPSRDEWQKPHEVVTSLGLRSDEVIADIGAGSGYFARRFAHHAAKVYAVDIDEALLGLVRERAPANVETVVAKADDPMLRENSVDTIFICDVLHHIGNRQAYYPKLARALRPGGRIVIVDFFKTPGSTRGDEAVGITGD
jgi:ubiquinone/menaquinone biosynthesis C-methylase UbiE